MGITATRAIAIKNWSIDITYSGQTRRIPEPTEIGEVGQTGEFVEATPLDTEKAKLYIAGLQDLPEGQFIFNYIADDADQEWFRGLGNSSATVDVLITDSNDGKTAQATIALNGMLWQAPQAGQVKRFSVSFRPSSEWVFS